MMMMMMLFQPLLPQKYLVLVMMITIIQMRFNNNNNMIVMGRPLDRPILGNNKNRNQTADNAVNPPPIVPDGGSGGGSGITDLLPPILLLPTNSPSAITTPPPSQSPSSSPISLYEVTTSPNVIVTTINSPVIFTKCKQIYITSLSSEHLQPGESITISISGGSGGRGDNHSGIRLSTVNNTIVSTTTDNNLSYISFPEGTSIQDINTAMDGMTFISDYPGRYEFRILLKQQTISPTPTSSTNTDITTTTTTTTTTNNNNNNKLLVKFKITVNDIMDVQKARQQINENVTQLYTGDIYGGGSNLQGQMFVFESTAHDIIMYPSKSRQGPIVSAATFGNGRVIAVPHNLMLEEMEKYGHVSGQFYKNSISWLLDNPHGRGGEQRSSSSSSSSSNRLLLDAKIVTYSQSIYNWLTFEAGYTNVIKLESESQLINSLNQADIFVGWLGTSEPYENIESLKEFATNHGGGLFISEYGLGYEYWCKHNNSNNKNKNKNECNIPGNLLLREAGICFMSGDSSKDSSSSSVDINNNSEQPQEQEENPTTTDNDYEQQAIITITNNNISEGEEEDDDDDDDPTDSSITTTIESNNYNVVSEMLYDSNSYTLEEFYDGWYRIMMGGLYNSLPSDDYIICELDQAFDYHISTKVNPTPTTPVSNPIEKLLLYFEVLDVVQKLPNEVTAHRLAEPLYGIIPQDAPRILHRQVDIDTSRGRWHPTGLYAVPGEVVTITVPQDFVNKGYKIRINAHTDDISSRDVWYRFPYVHRKFDIIDSTTIEVANAFGGVIFVDLMDGSPGAFGHRKEPPNIGIRTITISNAIEHPYFVLGEHTDDEWITSLRNKPAPYAVLVCRDLIIVQRSSESLELEEPTKLMEWWQKVVTLQDDLAGYYEVDIVDRRTSPEIINVDVQISRGAAHAGYPIQASDTRWKNLADVERLTTHGSWGDFHELGHNHQRGWWTFPSDGEVTVNIFSVYCTRTLVDPNNMLNFQWVNNPVQIMREALNAIEQASASSDNNSSISAVVTYAEIEKHLPFWIQLVDGFGWEIMKAVFVEYEMDQRFNSSLLPRNAQEEKDQWLIRYSKMAGHDLTQFMKGIWGLEVSDSAINKVYSLGLPTWLPAMGGITDITAESNQTITFDLVAEALSMDGVVTVGAVTQGKKGNIIENLDGTYSYIPNEDFQEGTDSFQYSVTSSSGHVHNSTVEIIIETPILVEGTDDESTDPSLIANAEDTEASHSKLEDGWQGLVLLTVVLSLLAIVCCLLSRVLWVLNRRRGKTMLLTNLSKHKRLSEITILTSCSTSDASSSSSSSSSEILV